MSDHRRPLPARIAWVLAGLLIVSAAVTLWAARGASFTADEWGYLLDSVNSTPSTVLSPVVGHLTALLILAYHALYATVGLDHNWPYRTLSVATHLLCCGLLFVYARRRVGDGAALLATASILFLGTGADAFITLHQAAPVGALAAGLAALLALDRGRPGGTVFACLMLTVAVAGDTEGVILTVAILVEIILDPRGRRRAWVPLVPLALFTGWAIHYDPLRNQGLASASLHRVAYIAHVAASAVAGLAGVQLSSATLHRHVPALRLLAHLLAFAVLVLALVRVRRRGLTPRAVTFALTLIGYWVVLALARGSFPGSAYDNRYVFVGALLLVLLAVELLEGMRPARPRLVALGALVCIALNMVWIVVDGRFRNREGALVRAELAALELSRGTVAPAFQPDTNIRLVDVRAAGYFAAIDKYGSSPADTPRQLTTAPASARLAADAVLIRALGVTVGPFAGPLPTGGAPPAVVALRGGVIRPAGACLRLAPLAPLAVLDLRLPASGLIVRTPAGGRTFIWVRRFGPLPARQLAVTSAGTARLRAPPGRSTAPWSARLVTTRGAVACPAP